MWKGGPCTELYGALTQETTVSILTQSNLTSYGVKWYLLECSVPENWGDWCPVYWA